jgi:hypothetical protein
MSLYEIQKLQKHGLAHTPNHNNSDPLNLDIAKSTDQ